MGLFDKLKDKVTSGISNGVSNAVRSTVEKKTQQVVQEKVDKAADSLIQKTADAATVNSDWQTEGTATAGGLNKLTGIISGYASSAANEAAKNLKICPKCGESASADRNFCPLCGAALPEQTIAEAAVCKTCGKQNNIGERFCSSCGAKLPYAEQEEQAALQRDEEIRQKWKQVLPHFPVWNGGGCEFVLEESGLDSNNRALYYFTANDVKASDLAAYRELLKTSGFRPAGQYPSEETLYKRINGIVYCFSSEDAFMSNSGHLSVYFSTDEPHGGFDYKKVEKPEKKKGFFRLFR